MRIAQITPGAGGMYCGGCFRDNALVAAWRKLGHDPVMLPMYLPMTLDEEDQSAGAPMFFGGVNVYLQQKSRLFAKLPQPVHRLLNSPALLNWAAGSAAKTRAADVGELTVSMLQGESGRQSRELEELVRWLKDHYRPDAICLSNALLLGMTRLLKGELNVPVFCLLSGEDSFLDSLPEPHRSAGWRAAQDRAREIDGFSAPSKYFADRMTDLLKLQPHQVKVIPMGINLEGYSPAEEPPEPPVLGYFARMCREKGLPTLIDAFVLLKRRDRVKGLKLRVGGGMSPVDERGLVAGLRARLESEGLTAEFHPNLSRAQKVEFYRSLSVLSVPALFGEAFGLYLVEAWASGVPVVQPRHAAFPELIEQTGAGLLCEPDSAESLADKIEQVLLEPGRLKALRQAARDAVLNHFGIERTAEEMVSFFANMRHATVHSKPGPTPEIAHGLRV